MWIPIPAVEMNHTFLSFRMKKQKLKRASRRAGTLTPLLGDYLNHWLHIISLDLDSDHRPEQ